MRVIATIFLALLGLALFFAPIAFVFFLMDDPSFYQWRSEIPSAYFQAREQMVLVKGGICFLVAWGSLAAIMLIAARSGVGTANVKAGSQDTLEETRMIQEIYTSLSSMEQRVESLETILLERSRESATHSESFSQS